MSKSILMGRQRKIKSTSTEVEHKDRSQRAEEVADIKTQLLLGGLTPSPAMIDRMNQFIDKGITWTTTIPLPDQSKKMHLYLNLSNQVNIKSTIKLVIN